MQIGRAVGLPSCAGMLRKAMNASRAIVLVQAAVAWTLIWYDHVLQAAAMHRCDVPGASSPAFSILLAINLPLAIPRTIWDRYLPFPWSQTLLIVAVGVLWGWVALNVNAWREHRIAFVPKWDPLRFVVDFLLIFLALISLFVTGVLLEGVGAFSPFDPHSFDCYGADFWSHLMPMVIVACSSFAWCFWLFFFFGRDLLYCVRRRPCIPFQGGSARS
jgi:hypothetical protein